MKKHFYKNFDYNFFRDTRSGFTSLFKFEGFKNGKCIFSRKYNLSKDGEYFLQFYTEDERIVELISHKEKYTPIIHGEDYEVKLDLVAGENLIRVAVENKNNTEPKLFSRLFDAYGRQIFDDITHGKSEYHIFDNPEECESTSGYTPAVGASIKVQVLF